MSDEVNTPPRPPESPGGVHRETILAQRAALREVPQRPTAPEVEMKQAALALGQARLIDLRTQARRDAVIAVERARERAGSPRAAWTRLEADTVHAITDLLLQLQGQDLAKAPTDEPYREGA
jgi:hypothetical protein